MNKVDLPCIDCITLPVCRSIINDTEKTRKYIYPSDYDKVVVQNYCLTSIRNKCSLFKQYVKEHPFSGDIIRPYLFKGNNDD